LFRFILSLGRIDSLTCWNPLDIPARKLNHKSFVGLIARLFSPVKHTIVLEKDIEAKPVLWERRKMLVLSRVQLVVG
jgi:hypothetical protein